MNIAYACNDYYISQTGISIISLCENNKDIDDIFIYFIGKDVSEENLNKLKIITERYNRNFIYIEFDSIAYDLNISFVGRHIETIYAKAFFSRINNLDKVIYLDSDIVVCGSLKELWQMDLSNQYMGVVQTLPCDEYNLQLGLPKGYPLFNDGMAIINVAYCRENELIEKMKGTLLEYNGNPPVLSEGALNKICKGHVKFIDLKYNLMAGLLFLCNLDPIYMSTQLTKYNVESLKNACVYPVCVHYLTAFYNRPWIKGCTHPYKDKYEYYKSLSPWYNMPLITNPLTLRVRIIKALYEIFGPKFIDTLRKNIKRNK